MKTMSQLLSICLIALTSLSCNKDESSNTQQDLINLPGEVLLVGTNKINITPPTNEEIKMSGYSARVDPFDEIHDDLFIRTIVITDQDDQVSTVHVAIDQLSFKSGSFHELHANIVNQIDGLANLPKSKLFVSATHTHGGPSTSDTLHNPTAQYKTDRNNKILQSIEAAYGSRQEARMRVGSTNANNVNINRQVVQGNSCDLGTDPIGNSDKEVQFVEFLDMNNRSIASIILFGIHSTVIGQHNFDITGDLAGYTSRYIENNTDSGHVSLFVMSGGGDQSPVHRTQDSMFIDHPIRGVEAYGNRLGEQIVPELENAVFIEDVSISSEALPVNLILKTQEPQQRGIYGIRYAENFVMISTPFELFSSTVQELKQNPEFEHIFIQSLTNGAAYYIPPLETYNYASNPRCYETRTSIFTNTAEETFKQTCSQLLSDLAN